VRLERLPNEGGVVTTEDAGAGPGGPDKESGETAETGNESKKGVREHAARALGPPVYSPEKTFLQVLRSLILPMGLGLAFTLLFATTFTTALHDPKPHGVKVGVVAPAGTATQIAQGLDRESDGGLKAEVVSSAEEARSQIENRKLYGAFVFGSPGDNEVLVASAASREIAQALPQVFQRILAAEAQRTGGRVSTDAKTVDVAPLPSGDASGSSGYFAMIALAIGAYLSALMLNRFVPLPLTGLRLGAARLAALAGYSLVTSLLVLILMDQIIGALDAPFVKLWLFFAFLVFAVSSLANALIHFFGLAGTAIVVATITIVGNPSAGGSVAWPLLPGFFRTIGPWLPNGAGTDGIRNIVYFNSHAMGRPLLVLSIYAALGIAITLVASTIRAFRRRPTEVGEVEASGAGAAVPLG
jgi:hypothetical protein